MNRKRAPIALEQRRLRLETLAEEARFCRDNGLGRGRSRFFRLDDGDGSGRLDDEEGGGGLLDLRAARRSEYGAGRRGEREGKRTSSASRASSAAMRSSSLRDGTLTGGRGLSSSPYAGYCAPSAQQFHRDESAPVPVEREEGRRKQGIATHNACTESRTSRT